MVKGAKPEEVECLSEDEAFMVASVYSVESVFLVMQPEPEKADFLSEVEPFVVAPVLYLLIGEKPAKVNFLPEEDSLLLP